MINLLRCFFFLLSGLILSPEGLSFSATDPDWLAYGDLRGYLETCGCDPRTDLGGVARIAKLIQREKASNPRVLILDLGNNFDLPPEPDLKARYIGKALEKLPADAALFNRTESFYESSVRGKRPWVLSNQKKPKADIPAFRIAGDSLIFGYVWHQDTPENLSAWDQALTERIRKLQKKLPASFRILLFSGPDEHLRKALATALFTRIISSNTAGEKVQPGFEEMESPETLNRLGDQVRMVPLGGLGLLRGGKLRKKEAPSLEDLLKSSSQGSSVSTKSLFANTDPSSPGGELFRDISVTWLTPDFEGGSPLDPLMEEYRTEARSDFAKISARRLADLPHSPFGGAGSCQGCHPSAFEVWNKSSHAHALETLKSQGKDQDPECVSCHVVGWEAKGGFVSEKDSPHFSGVQCENCHGESKAHSQNPGTVKPAAGKLSQENCVSCHHTPHSPSFKFEEYWNRIKHGK